MKRRIVPLVIWAVVVTVFLCMVQSDISQLQAEHMQLTQENEQLHLALALENEAYKQVESEYECLQREHSKLENEKLDIETHFNCLYIQIEGIYDALVLDYLPEWDIQDAVIEALGEVLEDYEGYLSSDIYGTLLREARR